MTTPLGAGSFPAEDGPGGLGEQARTTRDSFCNTTKNFH